MKYINVRVYIQMNTKNMHVCIHIDVYKVLVYIQMSI